MPYTPLDWNDNDPNTPLSAARVEHIDQGVKAVSDAVDALGSPVVAADPNTVPRRDAGGRVSVGTPISATHAVPLGKAYDLFVRFVDQDGDPLPAGSTVTIRVNTTTGDIDDITFEEV